MQETHPKSTGATPSSNELEESATGDAASADRVNLVPATACLVVLVLIVAVMFYLLPDLVQTGTVNVTIRP